MRVIGPATEDEAVLAFLQAEIDSHRWASIWERIPDAVKNSVRNPTLGDRAQDHSRRVALNFYRGYPVPGHYPVGDRLFTGWPRDLEWRRVEYGLAELGDLLYAKEESWLTLTTGSRRVVEGANAIERITDFTDPRARAIASGIRDNARGIIARVQAGEPFPPLVAVTDGQRTVLVEGHTRATAYVHAQDPSVVEVLLGTSASLRNWYFF